MESEMDILAGLFHDLLFDYTLRTIALGTAVLGIVAGALGAFAVLRRQSLLGDAMSHAALPGVVLGFMLTGAKSPVVLMLGASLACAVGVLLILAITRQTRIKEDASMGIILSVFFGFGLLLLTWLQRSGAAGQAGLNSFLFGQAATLLVSDVVVMAIFGGLALLVLALFWKEFKLLSFDRDFGAGLGFPMQGVDILLTLLLVVAIVIGLQAVGVVLMSAMVVAPGVAARQWTNHLGRMVILSSVFGALAGVSGAMISSLGRGLSTGPVIVLCVSAIVAASLLFAPNRGLVWNALLRRRRRRQFRDERVLVNLYRMAQQHDTLTHPHSARALEAMHMRPGEVDSSLEALARRNLVRRTQDEQWALTASGIEEAEKHL
jgi:manganese/zinc/iron transport system permease protein